MKSFNLSKVLRSSAAVALFVGTMVLGGCSADAIMGPDETEAPVVNTSTQPSDPQPSNDDCSVGGC